jgi:hypothetical protein
MDYPIMMRISWNAEATIVPLGNTPGYSGTLASCLSHWRDRLKLSEQVTCFIATSEAIDGKVCLEPEDIAVLLGAFGARKSLDS